MLRTLIDLGVAGVPARAAKHVRTTNLVAMVSALAIGLWAPLSLAQGQVGNAAQNAVAALLYLGTLLLNRAGRRPLAVFFLVAVFHYVVLRAVWLFGFASGAALFYLPLILIPYLCFDAGRRRWAHPFALVTVVEWTALTALQAKLPARLAMMSPIPQQTVNTALVALGFAGVAAAFTWLFHRVEYQLDDARARADGLLLNVLPPPVAERLKADPDARVAERVEVTVMFADLVGFTPMSARVPPDEMVDLLNKVFTAFDEICDRAGVEKIRTIGDGYMAVAGAPEPRADHALIMTRVACEIRDLMATWPAKGGERLQVRIGLNSGEAIAGIVGTTRFHYDLWGDAVNVAARIESLGAPGRVHLARPTWAQVHESIDCEPRGFIEVKGKGQMETWFA